MSWLFKHKVLLFLLTAFLFYWIKNPAEGFGIFRKGIAVYNKKPILFFDCYISPTGKLHLESDLSKPENIAYWINNHLTLDGKDGEKVNKLIIGTGFDSVQSLSFSNQHRDLLQNRSLALEYYPSKYAVERYTSLQQQQVPCALLLKVK